MAVNNSLAKKPVKMGLTAYLSQDAVKKQINNVVGGKNGTRFISSIVSAAQATPALQECTNPSILSAALLGEALNLSPSPQLGQFYMVPFDNRKKGCKEAQFQRFELFLTEKRYDRDGCIASYSSDRKLSAADLLTGQYLEKELGKKVETLIASAKREVEESLINSFEQKLKENLAKDTIERMNIPEVLKRFSEMALEEK